MITMDDWGKDPSVQAMRRVFKEMEKSKNEILVQLDIPLFDLRIRGWLEKALTAFERTWSIANQMGLIMDEKRASVIYAHCCSKIIGSEGTEIPEGLIPEDKETARLINEVFK